MDYLLPDFLTAMHGTVRPPSAEPTELQKLTLALERFTVPELIFNPSDIGMQSAGLPECVAQSLAEVGSSFPGECKIWTTLTDYGICRCLACT